MADYQDAEIDFVLGELRGAVTWHNLSDWEKEFVESVQAQFEEGKTLTKKQVNKLQNIWENV